MNNTTSAHRLLPLDALRGVASLAVVWFHCVAQIASLLPAADLSEAERRALGILLKLDVGVPLFFTLSAICISASIETRAGGFAGMRNFYLARFRRIFPVYWVALFFFVFVMTVTPSWIVQNPQVSVVGVADISLADWVMNLLLLPRVVSELCDTSVPLLLPVSWSLSYEVQYYLVSGVFLLSRRAYWVTVLALSLGAAWSMVRLQLGGLPTGYASLMDGAWLYFLLGICCFQELQAGRFCLFWSSVRYGITALATLALIIAPTSAGGYLAVTALITEFGVRRLCAQSVGRGSLIEASLPERLGTISYSLYLTHLPFCIAIPNLLVASGMRDFWWLFAASVMLATVCAIGVAMLFHAVVERRFVSSRVAVAG